MFLKETGLEGLKKHLAELDIVMDELGFHRAWDYKMAHYDLKYTDPATNQNYYLRIPAAAVEGKLESPKTLLQFGTPYIGRHLFPHGIDREGEIPTNIREAAENTIAKIKEQL